MEEIFEEFVAGGARCDAVRGNHAFFGAVEEMVEEVLVPGGDVHGWEGSHAYC